MEPAVKILKFADDTTVVGLISNGDAVTSAGSVLGLWFAYFSLIQQRALYQSYCRRNYTDLVSIRDQTQNEAVKRAGLNSSTSFWIGLLRDDWEWTDGGRSAYRNWGNGSPQPASTSSPSDCVKLKKGKWNSVPCSNTPPAALCYSSFTPAAQSRLRTFHMIRKKLNYAEARAACTTNYTDLVTVYRDEDNAILEGIFSAWIDLRHSDKWSNGDDLTFSNLTGDCGSWYSCAAMKADGAWESLPCTQKRSFMCYTQGLTLNLTLIKMSWSEAQSSCRRNYTDLVSSRDQNQNEAVKTAGLNSSTSFRIGLLRDDCEWTDEGRSAYRNWETGHPMSDPPDCVKVSFGKWHSEPCSNNECVLCYRTSIHISDERMTWESALGYCWRGNRTGLLRIQSEADQKEVERELRRSRVSGTFWVGLGQSQLFGFWIWTDGTGSKSDRNQQAEGGRDANRLNELIRKASDVVGVELDSLMAVSERRTLSKLQTIMDNGSHPLYHTSDESQGAHIPGLTLNLTLSKMKAGIEAQSSCRRNLQLILHPSISCDERMTLGERSGLLWERDTGTLVLRIQSEADQKVV
ncbi:hypothetical protein NFI96_005584 [Prochilodus magdalenae]|nr:hypothetical protein NFI96_005584 [Prochilodus magdalenae]